MQYPQNCLHSFRDKTKQDMDTKDMIPTYFSDPIKNDIQR